MQLSRADRLGAWLLSILILTALLFFFLFHTFEEKKEELSLSANEQQEMERFLVQMQEVEKSRLKQYQQKNNAYRHREKETFYFNPNTADYETFLRLGLYPWQARNALKYRQKGGVWRKPEDFSKLYGLSQEDFLRLKPYIVIPEKASAYKYVPAEKTEYTAPVKLKEGYTIPLNTSDTTLLKQIPGIGSYYASKIQRYKERLGGFVSTIQLREIEGLPGDIQRWFHFDPVTIKKISVNKASFKELVRHPYLNYEQVKVVVNYIRQYGPLQSWQELRYSKHFTEEDFRRLAPYFEFER